MASRTKTQNTVVTNYAVLGLLSLTYGVSVIDRNVVNLLVDPIKKHLHISDTEVGLLQGLAFLSIYSICQIPLGWLSDRTDRARLIAIAIVIWSLLTVGCGISTTFSALFLCRMGVGVAEAALLPSAVSLISERFPAHRLGTALALFTMGGSAGHGLAFVIGGAIYGWLLPTGGVALPGIGHLEPWQGTFVTFGLAGLPLALLFLQVRDSPSRPGQATSATSTAFREVGQLYRAHWRVLLPINIGQAAFTTALLAEVSWASAVFTRAHGWTIETAGSTIGTALLLAAFSGLPIGGICSDILSRQGPRGRALPMIFSAPFCILSICAFGLTANGNVAAIALFVALFFNNVAGGVSLGLLQSVLPLRLRGLVTAIAAAFTSLISLTAPALVGFLNDTWFGGGKEVGQALALVVLAVLLIGLIVLVDFYRRMREVPHTSEDGIFNTQVSHP